jgi:signal transduction histidine kinase
MERAHLLGGELEVQSVAGEGTVLTMEVALAAKTGR